MKFSLPLALPRSTTSRPQPRGLRIILPLLATTLACNSSLLVPAAVAAPKVTPKAASVGADYRLGAGDGMKIVVSNHSDLDSEVVVRPDGKISLPLAGDVVAAGKTTKELAAQIESVLARTLNNARVQIVLTEAASRQASILGAVNKPASYDIKPNSRVLDLIAAAGGLSTKIGRVSGILVRNGAIIRFDLSDAFATPSGKSNIALKSGDLVQLEAQDFAKQLTVTGNVATPGAFDLRENLTVPELLAEAGGVRPGSALKRAHILRAGKVLPMDLSETESGRVSPNSPLNAFKFQPGDVLVVPVNTDRVNVMGQVTNPSLYSLSEDETQSTILKMLGIAGGPAENADLSKVTLTRFENGHSTTTTIDVKAMRDGTAPDNIFLKNNDALFVPKYTDSINVMGQVDKPGSYLLPEDATQTSLLSVLSMAGGPAENADLTKVALTRTENGRTTTTTINAKAMRDGTAPDNVFLKNNDALFVPIYNATVSIVGPVDKPGVYLVQENQTLLSLLAQAGTISRDAGLRRAYILRDGTQIPIDLYPGLVAGALDPKIANFRLQNGDGIYIPNTADGVTITGAVTKPGPYSLNDDLTVVALLARAGNQTPEAALSKAYVIRKGINIPLDLNVFLSGDTSQPSLTGFRLQPGDTLFVPENKVFYAVVGQVSTPGKFPYPDRPADATVLRALINAGGQLSGRGEGNANLKDAGILREVNGRVIAIPVNLQAMFNNRASDKKDGIGQNFVLQPYDVLYVPAKGKKFGLADGLAAASVFRIFG